MTRNNRSLLTFVNYALGLFLGIVLILFCRYTASVWGIRGLLLWLVALSGAGAAFAAFSYVLAVCFPERRFSQFKRLFDIAGICVALTVFFYGFLLSERSALLLEGISGNQVDLLIALHAAAAFFASRLAGSLSGRVPAAIVFAILMVSPSQACFGMLPDETVYPALLTMLHLALFFRSRIFSRRGDSPFLTVLILLLSSPVLGAAAFYDGSAFILIIAECLYISLLQRNREGKNPDGKAVRIISCLLLTAGGLSSFFALACYEAQKLNGQILHVVRDHLQCFIPGGSPADNLFSVWAADSYADDLLYFHSVYSNQLVYGFLLVGALGFTLLAIRRVKSSYFVPGAYLLFMFIKSLISGGDSVVHLPGFFVMALFCGGLFEEMVMIMIMGNRIKTGPEAYPGEKEEKREEKSKEKGHIIVDDINREQDVRTETDDGSGVVTQTGDETDIASGINEEQSMMADINEESETLTALNEEEELPEGAILTIDDILGISAGDDTERFFINDGSDGSLIESPISIPAPKKTEEMDFDIEVDEDEDFDI